MSVESFVMGLVRGARNTWDGLSVSPNGAIYTIKDLPDNAELVNQGLVWSVGEASATASVIAPPTTTAGVLLYNDNPDGGPSLIVLAAFALQTASAAAVGMYGLSQVVIMIKPATKPTADIAVASYKGLKSLQGPYGGKAIFDLGPTVVDDLWKPVGNNEQVTLASAVGSQLYVPLVVPVVLPPGGSYGLECVSSNTSIQSRLGVVFAEVQLRQA
tara:strand:- start:1341 stop:1985 length:645 start_codon:yes stop_codon:yes gene_type:complete